MITTPIRERIHIYGLFDRVADVCYYVGQSRCTDKRRQQHFNPFTGRARLIPNVEFRILRPVLPTEDPATVEREVIATYKAKGEATLNSDAPPQNYRSSAYYFLRWVERDVVFAGFGEAGRAFGCTAQTVANRFKDGARCVTFDEGITLILKTWDEFYRTRQAQ